MANELYMPKEEREAKYKEFWYEFKEASQQGDYLKAFEALNRSLGLLPRYKRLLDYHHKGCNLIKSTIADGNYESAFDVMYIGSEDPYKEFLVRFSYILSIEVEYWKKQRNDLEGNKK